MEDAVQVAGQHLRGALRAELVRERLGQRREAGDVGEERRPATRSGSDSPRRERPAAVAGDVGRPVSRRAWTVAERLTTRFHSSDHPSRPITLERSVPQAGG